MENRNPNRKLPFCKAMPIDDIRMVVNAFGQAVLRAQKAGCDGIQIHAAHGYLLSEFLSPFFNKREDEVFYLDAARRYKERIGVPLMLVGGIRSLSVSERVVRDNLADYISISRPLIREPGLINRWKSGDTRKSECRLYPLLYAGDAE